MARTFAIGDIHGCAVALDTLLQEIQPRPSDTIIGMGDYVDRGPESSRVIEILISLVSHCRMVPLIGNHEIMMFKAINDPEKFDFWVQFGGNTTLASYGNSLRNIPQHHLTFLSHCVRYHETENHFFVHANYEADTELDEQPDELLFWEHIKEFTPSLHFSGKTAIVGHTPQLDGEVRDLGHVKLIDTHCYGGQWLTALDVNNDIVIQANNEGHLRTSRLESTESN